MSYLSNLVSCPVCQKGYHKNDTHRCAPAWEVWEDFEDREDALVVYAHDAEEAATSACEEWDSGEAPQERTVFVCPQNSEDEPEQLKVEWEAEIVYSAYTA